MDIKIETEIEVGRKMYEVIAYYTTTESTEPRTWESPGGTFLETIECDGFECKVWDDEIEEYVECEPSEALKDAVEDLVYREWNEKI